MKNYIFTIILFMVGSCTTNYKCKKENLKDISEMTKSGLDIYISLKSDTNERYLLTTQQLRLSQYKETKLNGNFIDSLRLVLLKKYWHPKYSIDNLKKYASIDTKIYNSIVKESPTAVFNQYIEKNGCPKIDKYSENEIRAAVYYMVENCALVTTSQAYAYVVYQPPLSKVVVKTTSQNTP